MFDSVLIANRGEIACRVMRTAKRLGLRTVAVYSQADRDAPFVRQADEAHCIGPAPASESYLVIDAIIAAARQSNAAAIHPGYGFLSERPEFVEACLGNGIVFVGPPASAMRAMGLKDAAKTLVEKAGVPVVPGYHGARQEPDFLRQKAYEIGYPVLIKAVAGGGGKGMKRVDKAAEFDAALESAQREASSAFGDQRVLVEKYVAAPRHIEIQVFADAHGHCVHLFERDCSLQRRHQKVIEEAPAPGMTPAMRETMGRAAVEAARAVGYVGAGTVEFIADGREGLRPERFYFMEMNTRLQVEHPVTEAITGLDLVEWQFRVAAGEPLPFTQAEVGADGHAVEARLYAEDPERGFLPSTGKLWALRFPEGPGLRVDTGVEEGGEVTPFYDPMLAKLIAHAPTREAALDKLAAALGELIVAGPKTNAAFLRRLCQAAEFRAGRFDTGFIDRNLGALGAVPRPLDDAAVAAAAARLYRRQHVPAAVVATATGSPFGDPWNDTTGFQLLGARRVELPIVIDGERHQAAARYHDGQVRVAFGAIGVDDGGWRLMPQVAGSRRFDNGAETFDAGEAVIVVREGRQATVRAVDPFAIDLEHLDDSGGAVKSPMHGKLAVLLVQAGDCVEKGQRVAVVEAMKMEHALTAPTAGTVAEVAAAVGAQVAEGAIVLVVRAAEEEA